MESSKVAAFLVRTIRDSVIIPAHESLSTQTENTVTDAAGCILPWGDGVWSGYITVITISWITGGAR
jgi:hypothetical protein